MFRRLRLASAPRHLRQAIALGGGGAFAASRLFFLGGDSRRLRLLRLAASTRLRRLRRRVRTPVAFARRRERLVQFRLEIRALVLRARQSVLKRGAFLTKRVHDAANLRIRTRDGGVPLSLGERQRAPKRLHVRLERGLRRRVGRLGGSSRLLDERV